jgi:hypothetical protein
VTNDYGRYSTGGDVTPKALAGVVTVIRADGTAEERPPYTPGELRELLNKPRRRPAGHPLREGREGTGAAAAPAAARLRVTALARQRTALPQPRQEHQHEHGPDPDAGADRRPIPPRRLPVSCGYRKNQRRRTVMYNLTRRVKGQAQVRVPRGRVLRAGLALAFTLSLAAGASVSTNMEAAAHETNMEAAAHFPCSGGSHYHQHLNHRDYWHDHGYIYRQGMRYRAYHNHRHGTYRYIYCP